jgi:thioredoxin reductase
MPDSASIYDCIIVGGGPAGLTCAIFLGRYRRRVLLCDSGRPRNYASRAVHGFIGQHNIDPAELRRRGREEAIDAGVEICDCTVSKIESIGDEFCVTTTAGTMRTRRVALAYGVRDLVPEIPNITDFYPGSVYHCPDCDGYEVTGKRVGVIGHGKRVVGLALKLRQWTDELTIFVNGNTREFTKEEMSKALAEGIDIKDEKVLTLTGHGDQLSHAVLDTGERVEIDALFFSIGTVRSCTLAEDLGCQVFEEQPCIVVDDYKQTTVEGVYAIGDLAPGSQLAVTSAADGAVAAIAINKSLLPPSRLV